MVQQRNLVSLVDRYRNLQWDAVDFEVRQPNTIRPISPAGENAAKLARVDFNLKALSDLPIVASELSWMRAQDAQLIETATGFRLDTAGVGYVVQSRIGAEAFSPAIHDMPRIVGVSLSGRTIEGEFHVGILSGDQKRWLYYDQLPRGEWHYQQRIILPSGDEAVFLTFDQRQKGGGRMELTSAELRRVDPSDCRADRFSIQQYYQYAGTQEIHSDTDIVVASNKVSVYFNTVDTKLLKFERLELSGLPASCVAGWFTAEAFPAGTVPVGMVLQDGKLLDFTRGSWGDLWRKFLN